MAGAQDDLTTVGVEEARSVLGRLVDDLARTGPVLLTKRGRPAAVLVSITEYERLLHEHRRAHDEQLRSALLETRRLLAHSPEGASLIDEAIQALEQPH